MPRLVACFAFVAPLRQQSSRKEWGRVGAALLAPYKTTERRRTKSCV